MQASDVDIDFYTILDSLDEAVIAANHDKEILYLNRAAQQLTGWSQAEIEGRQLAEIGCFWVNSNHREGYVIHRTGQHVPTQQTIFPLKNKQQQIIGQLLILRDRTARQQQEQEYQENLLRIKQAKHEWEATADALPQLICLLDEQQRVIRTNRTLEMWGLGQVTQVRGQTLPELFHPNIPPQESYLTALLAKAWPKLLAGQSMETQIEDTLLRRHFNILFEPIRFPYKYQRLSFTVVVIHDITKRKVLEAELNHAQKMEAIGRLAGGVAHDFNNILMAVIGDCELLLDDLGQEYQELLDIKQNGERGVRLIKQLLTFGQKTVINPTVININDSLLNMKRLIRSLAGNQIELHLELTTAPSPTVKIDMSQFEQLMLNLVVNACDAMPQGGQLTIQTGQASTTAPYPKMDSTDYILFSVTDTGMGIEPEMLSHIFEPFFSTKGVGQGTGLGLATVHGVVEQNGGYITVESEKGQGTTFTIYLPKVQATPTPLTVNSPPPLAIKPHQERILVVEDEPSVLRILQKILTKHGYETITAPHGQDALNLLEEQHPPIQLLITDVIMPEGLNGYQLAKQFRAKYPQLKTLFISGYADHEVIPLKQLEPWMSFLHKPFELNILTTKVEELLSQ